ncbi:hypothetical protein LSAT2_022717 [Lamellibrachia satsuma]|nr:hypothetical protein LSAT2_022717 [Lamellibrachia satsuma]
MIVDSTSIRKISSGWLRQRLRCGYRRLGSISNWTSPCGWLLAVPYREDVSASLHLVGHCASSSVPVYRVNDDIFVTKEAVGSGYMHWPLYVHSIQYGYVNRALELMIVRRFGSDTWRQIKEMASVNLTSPFNMRMLYDDKLTFSIIESTSQAVAHVNWGIAHLRVQVSSPLSPRPTRRRRRRPPPTTTPCNTNTTTTTTTTNNNTVQHQHDDDHQQQQHRATPTRRRTPPTTTPCNTNTTTTTTNNNTVQHQHDDDHHQQPHRATPTRRPPPPTTTPCNTNTTTTTTNNNTVQHQHDDDHHQQQHCATPIRRRPPPTTTPCNTNTTTTTTNDNTVQHQHDDDHHHQQHRVTPTAAYATVDLGGGRSTDDIWEMFGESFFNFCEESGYDKILRVLGRTLLDFLQNLDALHDHLSTIYPRMRSASFRCSQRRKDGELILHYYSQRKGMEYMVVGLVKAVARRLRPIRYSA